MCFNLIEMSKLKFLFFSLLFIKYAGAIAPLTIYGPDQRREAIDLKDTRFLYLNSIAAVVQKNLKNSRHWVTYGERYGLCEEVKFSHQKSIASCTAFLINTNTLMTADHCVLNSEKFCDDFNLVFDYYLEEGKLKVSPQEIYQCNRVSILKDQIALIHLTRNVSEGRIPIKLPEVKSDLKKSSKILVLGFPGGLPMKVSTGNIQSISSDTIVTNVDTFVNNSGSPAFSIKSGELIGVLIKGGKDFEQDDQRLCHLENVCASQVNWQEANNVDHILKGCTGESIRLLK